MALNVLHLVVGKTRTGKSIICATNLEEINAIRIHFGPQFFSADDLFDAFALFSYLLIRSARKNVISQASTRSIHSRFAS